MEPGCKGPCFSFQRTWWTSVGRRGRGTRCCCALTRRRVGSISWTRTPTAGSGCGRRPPGTVPLLPGLQLDARLPGAPRAQRLLPGSSRSLRPPVLPAVLRGPAGGAPAPGGHCLWPDHPCPRDIVWTLLGPVPAHERPPALRGLRGRSHLFPVRWVGAVGRDWGFQAGGTHRPGTSMGHCEHWKTEGAES